MANSCDDGLDVEALPEQRPIVTLLPKVFLADDLERWPPSERLYSTAFVNYCERLAEGCSEVDAMALLLYPHVIQGTQYFGMDSTIARADLSSSESKVVALQVREPPSRFRDEQRSRGNIPRA